MNNFAIVLPMMIHAGEIEGERQSKTENMRNVSIAGG